MGPSQGYDGRPAVLFIQYALCEGGAGYQIARLADALADLCQVHVAAHVGANGAVSRTIRSAQLVRMGLSLIANAAAREYRYIDAAMPLRPAHVSTLEALRMACPRAKIGLRFHGEAPFLVTFDRRMLRRAAALADLLIFHHAAQRAEILALLGDPRLAARAAIAPPGIDVRTFRPGGTDPRAVAAYAEQFGLDGDTPVIAMAGRPAAEKNWLDYILFSSELRRRRNGRIVCLAITGAQRGQATNAYLRRMIQFCRDLGAPVRVTGFLPDWQNLLASVDVYVQMSCSESFCRAAAEATAMGIPVVATAVGGLGAVVVEDGVTGSLIRMAAGHRWNARLTARDREAFADAAEQPLLDASVYCRMARAAVCRAWDVLDDRVNIQWHRDLISDLIGAHT